MGVICFHGLLHLISQKIILQLKHFRNVFHENVDCVSVICYHDLDEFYLCLINIIHVTYVLAMIHLWT